MGNRSSKGKAAILRALAEKLNAEEVLRAKKISSDGLKEILIEAASLLDQKQEDLIGELIIYIDGASRGNPGPSAAGVLIEDDRGRALIEDSVFLGDGTNNAAEYGALIHALEKARMLRGRSLKIHSDSELLVKQMQGFYRVKQPALQNLFFKAKRMLGNFRDVRFIHVPREDNRKADVLANIALDEYINNRKEEC